MNELYKLGDPSSQGYKDLCNKLVLQGLYQLNETTVLVRCRYSSSSAPYLSLSIVAEPKPEGGFGVDGWELVGSLEMLGLRHCSLDVPSVRV